jgi:mono/diheme cytochrome c family protein
MKKILLVLILVAVMAFWAMPAAATISATSHSLGSSSAGGDCAVCHVAHGSDASGSRLWAGTITPPGSVLNVGEVSQLCGYCHWGTAGGGSWENANVTTLVWDAASHGVQMDGVNPPRQMIDPPVSGTFPYYAAATDTAIECTSCHDVHSDPAGGVGNGFRPFLRAPIEVICSQCHGTRRYAQGVLDSADALGLWGTNGYQGINNRGSHPVGTDVTGDNFGVGTSPITFPDEVTVLWDNTADSWAMGGHLHNGTDTGGVTCVTCHAVHGIQNDSAEPTAIANAIPNAQFLVFGQGLGAPDNGRQMANGNGDYNALCEACHWSAAVVIDTDYNADAPHPNPGGTAFGHPVDDMEVISAVNWLDAFGDADWPVGNMGIPGFDVTDNNNITTPQVICESCHVPHPAANVGRVDDDFGGFVNSDYILRNDITNICDNCHDNTNSVAGHHPVGVSYTGRPAYLSDNGTLVCTTCHSSSGGHNWQTLGGVGLDPDWLPADNGRDADNGVEQYNVNMSITCMDCHYNLYADNGKSPTPYDGMTGVYAAETDYATIGSGTHFVGLIGQNAGGYSDSSAWWDAFGAVGSNIQAYDWDDTEGDGVQAYSRFGGADDAPVLVCESCHELEPTGNVDTHLLLGAYIEDPAADQGTEFCATCHEPSGTHPLTGDNIDRADPDRTLSTDYTNISWLVDPAADPNLVLSSDTDNFFTCDSCHQVHDANTNSRTFILDTEPLNVQPAPVSILVDPTDGNYTTDYVTTYQQSPGGDHSEFCNQCHPYK